MKKYLILICITFYFYGADFPNEDPPQTEITNGVIKTSLYLPDKDKGYYRGTRFDWSGAFKSLEYKGHSYIGQWFDKYDPQIHDAITGPVEEFMAIGYEDAKAGENFMKIGVGVLRKPEEEKYAFSNLYKITNAGKWTVKNQPDQVTFVHELTDTMGYAYIYQKVVRLTKGKPELVLEHRLKNTGQKVLETSVYNHNFFMIDKAPTGPDIQVEFPFEVSATGLNFGSIAKTDNKKIIYTRELNKEEHVFSAGLKGLSNKVDDYNIKIENKKTGAGVRITSDRPIAKLVYWASSTTSCPEPYIQLRADRGQEVKWKISYEFYTGSPATSK